LVTESDPLVVVKSGLAVIGSVDLSAIVRLNPVSMRVSVAGNGKNT
jgi:hypothetical protein